jgi:hypothetical protein
LLKVALKHKSNQIWNQKEMSKFNTDN